jgi:hypothetical protein
MAGRRGKDGGTIPKPSARDLLMLRETHALSAKFRDCIMRTRITLTESLGSFQVDGFRFVDDVDRQMGIRCGPLFIDGKPNPKLRPQL